MTRSILRVFTISLFAAGALMMPANAQVARATFPGANGLIAFQDYTPDGTFDIFTVNPDGTGLRNITSTPQVDDFDPAFSPDGTRIAFVRYAAIPFDPWCYYEPRDCVWTRDLWVMNADGTGATNITNGSGWFTALSAPAWSPDGSELAVVATDVDGNYGLWRVTVANGSRTFVVGGWWPGAPEWSPDGTRIVLAVAPTLGVIDANGSAPVLIGWSPNQYSPDGSPSWSPDGKTILYWVFGFMAPNEIWTVSPDGSGNKFIGYGGEATYAPDGTMIAYSDGGIYVMHADGTNPTQLTATGYNPNWGRRPGPLFPFQGFFAPVDDKTMNVAKAGSAIPVKFSLGGDRGLDIFAPGYPTDAQISCQTGEPLDAIESYVAASASKLVYDPASGQYNYIWKTDKSKAGKCFRLSLMLSDGQLHTADFLFK